MAIIHNYNDIESIISEKYIIKEKVERGFFKSKKVYIEELEFKRKDIYNEGKLVSFEEIEKTISTGINKTYGTKSRLENGEFSWTIKEYENNKLKRIKTKYFNINGDCYKEIEEDYSLSYKTINYCIYKLQYNQQNLLVRKEATRDIEIYFNKREKYLSHIVEYEYDINNKCTKKRWNEYEDGCLQEINEYSYIYDNKGNCIKSTEIENVIFQAKHHVKEKGIRTIFTENAKYNQLGDCIYNEGMHYTKHFKCDCNYKYDLRNNCTEYRRTMTIDGNFDSEIVWRYNINYK